MTARELVMAMLRRWYVVVAVLAIATVVTLLFARDGGIYTTRTVVAFTLPTKTTLSAGSGTDDASVIAFAGAVAQDVNGGHAATTYSTNDAPFYGAGVRQGVLVGLPNAGNQWVSAYLRAEIEIQIVGRTADWVTQTQTELVSKVLQTSQRLQAPVASASDRIIASVEPLTLQVEYITPTRGSQLAAAAAMLIVALIVAGVLSALIDRRLGRRRPRRSTHAFLPSRSPSGDPTT